MPKFHVAFERSPSGEEYLTVVEKGDFDSFGPDVMASPQIGLVMAKTAADAGRGYYDIYHRLLPELPIHIIANVSEFAEYVYDGDEVREIDSE